jgi:hypothetical protein
LALQKESRVGATKKSYKARAKLSELGIGCADNIERYHDGLGTSEDG